MIGSSIFFLLAHDLSCFDYSILPQRPEEPPGQALVPIRVERVQAVQLSGKTKIRNVSFCQLKRDFFNHPIVTHFDTQRKSNPTQNPNAISDFSEKHEQPIA
ncbi:MAG: hypothetical protein HLX50_01840 [Alteromonadaceae bacterium]|nr:hypothetical protein [Alteromonadaceae bacterium]